MDKRLLSVTHPDDDPDDSKCFLAGIRSSLSGDWDDPSQDDDEEGSPTNWAFRCGWAIGELSKITKQQAPNDG